MLISPTKALKLYKVSKPTLYEHMKSGKLSFSKDGSGRRKIDIAELERMYPKRKEEQDTKTSENNSEKTFSNGHTVALEKALLEQQVKSLEKEVEHKQEAIDQWQKAFEKAQSTADKITALLEHQSSQYAKSEKIDTLETMMKTMKAQNDDLLAKEKARQDRQAERRKQREKEEAERLEAEQNRSFWSKLIG